MSNTELTVDGLVIGWGNAGKTIAGRLAAEGRKVALVERSAQMYGCLLYTSDAADDCCRV